MTGMDPFLLHNFCLWEKGKATHRNSRWVRHHQSVSAKPFRRWSFYTPRCLITGLLHFFSLFRFRRPSVRQKIYKEQVPYLKHNCLWIPFPLPFLSPPFLNLHYTCPSIISFLENLRHLSCKSSCSVLYVCAALACSMPWTVWVPVVWWPTTSLSPTQLTVHFTHALPSLVYSLAL